MGGISSVGKSVSKAVSGASKSVSHAVSHAAGDIARGTGHLVRRGAHNKFVRTGVGYYFGNVFTGAYAYLRGTQDAQNMYNLATGHYQRQQKRIEKEMQRQQEKVERQQREYAFQQRKAQIDEMRERIGVGGSRYRTDKQQRATSTLWGSSKSGETLG